MTHVDTAVRKSITVPASQQRAFEVFTAQLGRWWPKDYHIGQAEMADFVIEPQVGGRWYEVGVDGQQCDTGRVLAYEPHDRVMLAWHIAGNWQFDPDPARASEVEVRFIAEGPNQTRVELEHRGFDRRDDGQAVHAAVAGEMGWGFCLGRFAAAV
jgi:uncharacterized protein YndB with AHSA1/START domain